jgi:hypothetical protein
LTLQEEYDAMVSRLPSPWLTYAMAEGLRETGFPDTAPALWRFICARAQKSVRGRPLAAGTIRIREALLGLQDRFGKISVRGAYYQLLAAGVVPKDEKIGYRPVQRQVLELRRAELLPWSFVSDGSRWRRRPTTYNSTKDALLEIARTYRRNLWLSQGVRIEIWLEKDALASLIAPKAYEWGVDLMVSRGQSSDTFCVEAAQEAKIAWEQGRLQTVVYALYDADRSGRNAAAAIRRKLDRYSDGAPIAFSLLAVTDEQIEQWELPTRPAKEDENEVAVELDAIPPDLLIGLVDDAIQAHVDEEAWAKEEAVEESERRILEEIAGVAA